MSFSDIFLRFLLIALPPIACFATHGVVWVLAGLALLRVFLKNVPIREIFLLLGQFGVLPFFLWAWCSLLWSVEPLKTLILALSISFLVIGGLLSIDLLKNLKAREKEKLLTLFFVSLGMTLIFYNIDVCFRFWQKFKGYGSPTKTYSQWSVFLALMFWPLAQGLTTQLSHKKLLGGVLGVIGVTLLSNQYHCDSAWLAWILSLLSIAIFCILPLNLYKRLGIAGLVLSIFIFPGFTFLIDDLEFLKTLNMNFLRLGLEDIGFMQRIYIWGETSRLAFESPWVGYGLDCARYVGQKYVTYPIYYPHTMQYLTFQQIPTHPHNAPLQIFLELGGIGLFLFTGGLLKIFKKIFTLHQGQHVFVLGLMVTALSIAWFNLGLWQSWWISSLFLSMALLHLSSPEKTPSKR